MKDSQAITKWYRAEHSNTHNFRDFLMMLGHDMTDMKTWEDKGYIEPYVDKQSTDVHIIEFLRETNEQRFISEMLRELPLITHKIIAAISNVHGRQPSGLERLHQDARTRGTLY